MAAAPMRTVVLIGNDDLTRETAEALQAAGARVRHLCEPDEGEVARALDQGADAVAVVERSDAIVLRMALMVRAVSDRVALLLTLFDETMATTAAAWPHTQVTSLAEIVAPSLAGPCVDERFTAISDDEGEEPVGLVDHEGELKTESIRPHKPQRLRALARDLLTPHDRSAGLLFFGSLGLLGILALEAVTSVFVLDQKLVDATYGAAKTLVTVGPNPDVAKGPAWYKLFTSATMVVALVFSAGFTAGLVNRVIDRRLTGLVGRRAVPRRDHVVVVGLGQVGLKLCLLLRACGIPLVAVERDAESENVGLAKELGLPVVLGRGADRSLLRRLSLPKARALAAVTSDDLENISVAMSARSIADDLAVVVRVGDGDVANETRSLLGLALVRDVHRIAASVIAARALGRNVDGAVCLDDAVHLRCGDGSLQEAPFDAPASGGGRAVPR